MYTPRQTALYGIYVTAVKVYNKSNKSPYVYEVTFSTPSIYRMLVCDRQRCTT